MSNEQLVIRIKAGENVAENMKQLYNQATAFIHALAWKYRGLAELEDLEQEGYLALYPAIDGYDPERGMKFLTYAESWIRQGIVRYIGNNKSCLRLPVHCLEDMRRYERFVSGFAAAHGREPTDTEAQYYLGLATKQIREIQRNICKSNLGSLDSPITGLDGREETTVGELVASGEDLEDEVVDRLYQEELRRELWDCVDSLPGRQPEVLRMHYQKGMSLSLISKEYGTTPETVRQIHTKALRELRKPRFNKRLSPYLPEAERIYSMALVGGGASHFNRTWTSSTERVALELLDKRFVRFLEEGKSPHLEGAAGAALPEISGAGCDVATS